MGCPLVRLGLREEKGFPLRLEALVELIRRQRPQAVFLVNPNNPTARYEPREQVLELLKAVEPDILIVVDETDLEYTGEGLSPEPEAAGRRNLVVVKSMSKVCARSGVRAGTMVAHPELAAEPGPWLPPWPVGLPAQAAVMEALRRPDYHRARYEETRALREEFRRAVAHLNPLESDANYLLIWPAKPEELAARLRRHGIYVQEFFHGPLACRYLRAAVKSRQENRRMAEAMR
ncbi:MAG: aminotransferase class I/II-fold pyridoxal phosphate-dependent enzyme [Bryobacteraceae bacterium]